MEFEILMPIIVCLSFSWTLFSKSLLYLIRWKLCRQIEIDSKFLEAQHIMDYSLLLGVHYRAPQHLRSLASHSRRITADGLEIVAEDGRFLYQGLSIWIQT